MEKSVAVTGATGFLGKALVSRLLAEGYRVIALTRRRELMFAGTPRVEQKLVYQYADLEGPFNLPEGVEVIFHCAGAIDGGKEKLVASNIVGTRNVVKAALDNDCLLVHVSSAGVVGDGVGSLVDEDTPCRPVNLYEQTKYEAEMIVREAVAFGLRAQVVRPTIIFGVGREPGTDSFLQLLRAIKQGRYFNVGDGIYNLVPLQEVAHVLVQLAETPLPSGGVFFVNMPISFRKFSRLVKATLIGSDTDAPSVPYGFALLAAYFLSVFGRVSGKPVPLTLARLKALTNKRVFNAARLTEQTSYRSERTLEEWIVTACRDYEEKGLL